jgi:hypothetical protein
MQKCMANSKNVTFTAVRNPSQDKTQPLQSTDLDNTIKLNQVKNTASVQAKTFDHLKHSIEIHC